MSPLQMRAAVAGVYSGRKWKRKVDHMTDNQVTAIYLDFLKKGKFEKNVCRSKPKCTEAATDEGLIFQPLTGEQLKLF